MPTFLARSSCSGARPAHLSSLALVSRPALISRMLRERHVPRFIVATAGLGKTSLALDYAETVFGMRSVYWLDGSSPCFLRDLDDGIIAESIIAMAQPPFLVVIDDVPVLDPDRAERLVADVDRVLDSGNEVVAVCTPDNDVFGSQSDRVLLSATDLLLSEEEAAALPRAKAAALRRGPRGSARLAAFAWGDAGAQEAMFGKLVAEIAEPRELASVFAMAVLGSGSMEDAEGVVRGAQGAAQALAARYPLLGIDREGESFECAGFSPESIGRAFRAELPRIARACGAGDPDEVVLRLASALLDAGDGARACGTGAALLSRDGRAAWLSWAGPQLLREGCLLPASELFRTLSKRSRRSSPGIGADEAVRLPYLQPAGPEGRSARCAAAQAALRDAASPLERACAGLVLAAVRRENADVELADAALEALGQPGGAAGASGCLRQLRALQEAACIVRASFDGAGPALSAWLRACGRGASKDALLLSGAWLCDLASEAAAEREGVLGEEESLLVGEVAGRLSGLAGELVGAPALPEALACTGLQSLVERSLAMAEAPAAVASRVHDVELSLFEQRRRAREAGLFDGPPSSETPHASRARSGGSGGPARAAEAVPRLTVNLFGGLDVRIGDAPVPPSKFTRQKIKTLLALLVLNRGHEYPRDRLVELLWPESSLESARRNLYGIWGGLKRALTVEGRGCPYLVRQQQSLRIDASLLTTDVTRFDDVCHALLFERPGYGGWARLHAQIGESFLEELLPSEECNLAILRIRAEYRDRLVDALVFATKRLVEAGNLTEALWFGRAAVARDASREDAYLALMRAQIALGQRKPAMDTYFACRRYLADNLGIDPSVETVALYNSVIMAEEVISL